jgi:mannose-6-phosphate isomerase-like protein (cupin superfamily)
MGKVRLTTGDQQEWILSGERQLDDAERGKLRQGELTSSYRIREPGDAASPQLVELTYEPGAEIQTHCHDEDEIIYVLSGAMVIGARTVGPGACLTVPGKTFYGFHAGPEGLHLLNFRARPDGSFHLPPEKQAADA